MKRSTPLPQADLPAVVSRVDDDALMRRVAKRDGLAFTILLERHAFRAHQIAWRMLANGAEAEVVTEDCFLRLWREAPRWRDGGPEVPPWIIQTATEICRDHLLFRARFGNHAQSDQAQMHIPCNGSISDEEACGLVMRALDLLPDLDRAAIVLIHYENLSAEESARGLKLSANEFDFLLREARKTLGAVLNEVTNRDVSEIESGKLLAAFTFPQLAEKFYERVVELAVTDPVLASHSPPARVWPWRGRK